jgi:putative nucleotidyltransferase with HDIG domain
MFVQLDVGWLNHPFPVNSFKIASTAQIDTLKSLGLQSVRCVPHKSDTWPAEARPAPPAEAPVLAEPPAPADEAVEPPDEDMLQSVQHWRGRLADCNARFQQVERGYEAIAATISRAPEHARKPTESLVEGCLAELAGPQDVAIHLLSDGVGSSQSVHAVNVTVLSLLLGRALGLEASLLRELGLAALLHDAGKPVVGAEGLHGLALTPAVADALRERYQSHVGESVAIAQRMGLSAVVTTAIAQHHEWADGTGFPLSLMADDMDLTGQILALVNSYDRLCNPGDAQPPQTPHEALALLFSRLRDKFAAPVLNGFIRMMGVFPPGSVIELTDGRYAMVMSVNGSRPLKPAVMVYDALVPASRAPLLALESRPELGIRRGISAAQLPREALDYLSPRRRVCYYFERAVELEPPKAAP